MLKQNHQSVLRKGYFDKKLQLWQNPALLFAEYDKMYPKPEETLPNSISVNMVCL